MAHSDGLFGKKRGEKTFTLQGATVKYVQDEADVYDDSWGHRRKDFFKAEKGKRHAQMVSPKRMQPRRQTRYLMDLSLELLKKGSFADVLVAEKLSELTGIPVTGKMISEWKRRYPRFAQAYKEAQEEAVDKVEAAAFRRALSDDHRDAHNSAKMILEAKRAEYRRKLDVTSQQTVLHHHFTVIANMSDDDVRRSLERHLGRSWDVDASAKSARRPLAPGGEETPAIPERLLALDDGASPDGRRVPQRDSTIPG